MQRRLLLPSLTFIGSVVLQTGAFAHFCLWLIIQISFHYTVPSALRLWILYSAVQADMHWGASVCYLSFTQFLPAVTETLIHSGRNLMWWQTNWISSSPLKHFLVWERAHLQPTLPMWERHTDNTRRARACAGTPSALPASDTTGWENAGFQKKEWHIAVSFAKRNLKKKACLSQARRLYCSTPLIGLSGHTIKCVNTFSLQVDFSILGCPQSASLPLKSVHAESFILLPSL